jgi:hypothetical protein
MKLWSLLLASLFLVINLALGAEVSEKKDIAVFPVYSSYNIPDAAYRYFDDKLVSILGGMKRFQVIGYQYRLDNNTAEGFITKIQELKKQSALQNPKYIDQDLGVAVIPATDMQKLVNSVFIFIPSITGFSETQYDVEVQEKRNGKIIVRLVKEYKTYVNVSVKIITSGGDLMDTYTGSKETTSRVSSIDAYNRGVDSAISGLGFSLRNMEQFKLKSQVLKTDGGQIYLETGKDLGIQTGYEFTIQKETKVLERFTEKTITGLVRVNGIGDQYSTATVIFGMPQPGDQLVESPKSGLRFNIFGGIAPMNIKAADIKLIFYDSSPWKSTNTNTTTFSQSSFVPLVGVNFEYELGYAGLFDLNFGLLINNPLAAYVEIGGGYELYFGMMSLNIGADLSFIGNYINMGKLKSDGYDIIGDVTYGGDEDLSIVGFSMGVKPKIGLNFQISQGVKLRIGGGYALYFLPWYKLNVSGPDYYDSSITTNSSVDLTDSAVNIYVNGVKSSGLPIDYSGPFGSVELILRF